MAAASNKKVVPFQLVISALLDESKMFPPSYLHRFSDIGEQEMDALKQVWPQINPARRLALLEDLEELAEIDTLVSFDTLAFYALQDPDAPVRETAVRMLWENQEDHLATVFLDILNNDIDERVRAAAAIALGQFVYLGELEEFPADMLKTVEDRLLDTLQSNDQAIVRRRALEALGFSSREEVPDLIQAGFDTNDAEWLSSAIFAMGRSMDPRWEAPVLEMLRNPDTRVQVEAVRAAGQLELAAARAPLLELLEDEELDEDVSIATLWSLSQIGGEGVRERLEEILAAAEDEEEVEYLERALENLSFTEDFEVFDMFDFDAAGDGEDDNPDKDSNDAPKSR